MEIKKTVDIVKWDSGTRQEVRDVIIVEEALEILVNGRHFVYLMSSPNEMDELAIGYLFAEGILTSVDQIESIDHLDWNRICVNIVEWHSEDPKDDRGVGSDEMRAITSGCGKGKARLVPLDDIKKIDSGRTYKTADITKWMKDFGDSSALFKETGGVHGCGILRGGEILFFSEDIGRHNALDKVIGKSLLNHIDFGEIILLTTGRISSDIAIKAAKAGIPVIVSFSAPTNMALEVAKKANITLIGFVRGNRMNIYNGEHRINFDMQPY